MFIKRVIRRILSPFIEEQAYDDGKNIICLGKMNSCNIGKKSFEPELRKVIRKEIEKDYICADVGANIGYHTLLMADYGKKAYAFEPDRKNFSILMKNIYSNHYRNIEPIKAAVSNKGEDIILYRSFFNDGDHRTIKAPFRRKEAVFALRLDDVFEKLDFLKIDAQGYDGFVIESLGKVNCPKIIFEFWPYGLKKACFSLNRLFNLLKDYRLFNIDDKTGVYEISFGELRPIKPLFKNTLNILAKRKNYTHLTQKGKVENETYNTNG